MSNYKLKTLAAAHVTAQPPVTLVHLSFLGTLQYNVLTTTGHEGPKGQ
jgi:hypothetical protein